MTPEGKIKKDIEKLLFCYGFIKAGTKEAPWPPMPRGWYCMPVPTGFGVNGIPDFICTWTPVRGIFTIEAKAPGKLNNTSVNQDRRHAEIRAGGGTVLVVDSAAMLDEWMERYVGVT